MAEKIRIVVAGMDASQMAELAQEAGGDRVKVVATADIDGARLVKSGRAHYYLGSCWSGGGGALASATAILGAPKVGIVATLGTTVSAEKVKAWVEEDRKSTRLNSSHANISYAVFCLKKKKNLSDARFF